MSQLSIAVAGGIAGAVIGSFIPGVGPLLGAQIGFTGGAILGGVLFGSDQEVVGARVTDLRVSSSAEGKPIPIPYGTIRLGTNTIWGDEIREVKKTEEVGGKGAAGVKSVEFTYFGNWCEGICEGPVDYVTRIWFDDKLVFDLTDLDGSFAGGILHASLIDVDAAFPEDSLLADAVFTEDGGVEVDTVDFGHIRIYLGTEKQMPDPMIAADSRIGLKFSGSPSPDTFDVVPAFRGLCYIAFQDVPLANYGNRLPQVNVEVTTSAVDAFPEIGVNIPNVKQPHIFERNLQILKIGTLHIDVFDLPNSAENPEDFGVYNNEFHEPSRVDSPGNRQFDVTMDLGDGAIRAFNGDTGQLLWTAPGYGSFGAGRIIDWPSQIFRVRTIGYLGVVGEEVASLNAKDGTIRAGPFATLNGGLPQKFLQIVDKELYALWPLFGGLYIEKVDPLTLASLGLWVVVDLGSPNISEGFMTHDPLTNSLLVHDDLGTLHRFRINDKVVDATVQAAFMFGTAETLSDRNFRAGPHDGRLWGQISTAPAGGEYREIDTINMRIVRDVKPGSDGWPSVHLNARGVLYDKKNHALILGNDFAGAQIQWIFLDRKTVSPITLQEIVDDISDRCGVSAADRDTSALAGITLTGYALGQRITGRRGIESLMAFNFGIRDTDFKAQAYLVGGDSVGTIPEADLGVSDDPSGTVPKIIETRQDPITLPEAVTIAYFDRLRDHQPATETVKRPREVIPSRDLETIQFPVVFEGGTKARQAAERILYTTYARQTHYGLSTFYRHIAFQAGDVIDFTADSVSYKMLIDRDTLTEGMIYGLQGLSEVPAVQDPVQISAGGIGFNRPGLPSTGIVKLFVLDAPLIRDQDDGLVIHFAVGVRTLSGVTGVQIIQSLDGGINYTKTIAVFNADEFTDWGYTTTVLPAPIVDFSCYDRDSTVNIKMVKGVLSSAPLLDVNNGVNSVIIGDSGRWEYLKFVDALALGQDSYTIEFFSRGRRGTNLHLADHVNADNFIVMNRKHMKAVTFDVADVGTTLYFKAVPFGQLESLASPHIITFAGESLKPYTVTLVKGSHDGAGTWTITWMNRTRVGGKWSDLVGPSIGEASEVYDLEMLDGPGGSVVHTQNGLTTKTATITPADIEAGIGSPAQDITTISVKIYQVSATVGRGFSEEHRVGDI